MNKDKELLFKLAKIYNLEKPNIIYNDIIGYCYSNLTIYLKRNNTKSHVFLLLHEFRHYYQDCVRYNNSLYSIKINDNFKKYNQKNYLSNIIELDAYSFSYLYMSKILKIDYELNIIIKDMVIDYIEKNKNDFKELL